MDKSTPSKIFQERLRTARERRDLTQAELATRAGLQPSAISHFEAGTRKPSFDNLRRLATALEVKTDYLLGRTGDLHSIGNTVDAAFRDFSRLSTADQEFAKKFLADLAARNKRKETVMAFKDSLIFAETKAELFLREHGINSLPVDPFAIARSLALEVKAKPPSAPGVSGMLLRNGDNYGILYATHIQSEGFQRFSIAHELAHYLLEGHLDHVFPYGQDIHESKSGFISQDPYEREADHFAAGLLMPRALFSEAMGRFEDGLAGIEALSAFCKTSLPATAIRYSQCAEFPIAVVMSTGSTVDYCFLSESLKDFGDLDWLEKGTLLPLSSATRRFNQDTENVQSGSEEKTSVNLQDWFGGRRSIEMSEEIMGLGSYGKTLTVLSPIVSSDEDDDEEDDEALVESWTPRF